MKTYGICYEITGQAARTLHWVALARSGSDFRTAMTWLHVQDGVAVATDGKRLHTAPVPKTKAEETDQEFSILPDGDYAVITSKSTMVHLAEIIDKEDQAADGGAIFPTWERVIPGGFPTKTGQYAAVSSKKGGAFAIEVAKLFEFCEYRNPVNHDYLSDLAELSPGAEWQVEYRTPEGKYAKALLFRQGEAMAVIMPLNLED